MPDDDNVGTERRMDQSKTKHVDFVDRAGSEESFTPLEEKLVHPRTR